MEFIPVKVISFQYGLTRQTFVKKVKTIPYFNDKYSIASASGEIIKSYSPAEVEIIEGVFGKRLDHLKKMG